MLIHKIFIPVGKLSTHASTILTSDGFLLEQKAPDHCAINRFLKFYLTDEVMDDIFYQQDFKAEMTLQH